MAYAWAGGDDLEDCPVCLTGFDDFVQRPRTQPCGHTVCTSCIDKLKKKGRVTCPECRANHVVPKGGQFPVNYPFEALIRRMRDVKAAAAAASLSPSAGKRKKAAGGAGKKEAAGLSKKIRSFLQEQENTVAAAITACRETQSQLDEYQAALTGWGERQQQLEDSLRGLVDQSRSARELLQQETFRVAAKKEEAKKREQQLLAVQEILHAPATEQKACMAVVEVLHKAEQVVEECQQCFPDASTLTTARKVREASKAALEAAQAVQAAPDTVNTEEPRPQSVRARPSFQSVPAWSSSQSVPAGSSSESDPDLTVRKKVNFILELIMKQPLQPMDLHFLTQCARTLVEAGQVFAVHQVEGLRRHARLSLEAGRLCLHALKKQPQTWGLATLQVSEVVPPSLPCTVFLDLSWPGRVPRRVYIRLSPDTPRGRQFMLLCTGQRGPSYLNTKLFSVENGQLLGRSVGGGDYESNDGEGTCQLLPGLDEGEYRVSGRAGAVVGWWPGKGQFGIITSDYVFGGWPLVFGEVVEGLHVVAEAAQHSNIKEVTVVDCGVMLRSIKRHPCNVSLPME